jgi:hypothetical protein
MKRSTNPRSGAAVPGVITVLLCMTACAGAAAHARSIPHPSIFALPLAAACPDIPTATTGATPLSEVPGPEKVLSTIPIDYGPAGVTIGFGSVWVAAHRGAAVFRVNPVTNRVIATIHVPLYKGNPGKPEGPITAGPHGIWVAIGGQVGGATPTEVDPFRLLRIDPTTDQVTLDKVFDGLYNVVDSQTGVWVGVDPNSSLGPIRKALINIDPITGSILRTVDLGPATTGTEYSSWFDAGFGSLWAVVASDKVVRVDPSSGKIVATIHTPGLPLGLVAQGGGPGVFVDVANAANQATVARVNPSTNCVDAVTLIGGVGSQAGNLLTESGGGLYVTFGKGSLALVDMTTMRSLGSVGLDAADYLGQAAFGFGSVWFPTWGDNTLLRVKPL